MYMLPPLLHNAAGNGGWCCISAPHPSQEFPQPHGWVEWEWVGAGIEVEEQVMTKVSRSKQEDEEGNRRKDGRKEDGKKENRCSGA